jgi:hypothetical protein
VNLRYQLVDQVFSLWVRNPLQEQIVYLVLRQLISHISCISSIHELHFKLSIIIILNFKYYLFMENKRSKNYKEDSSSTSKEDLK